MKITMLVLALLLTATNCSSPTAEATDKPKSIEKCQNDKKNPCRNIIKFEVTGKEVPTYTTIEVAHRDFNDRIHTFRKQFKNPQHPFSYSLHVYDVLGARVVSEAGADLACKIRINGAIVTAARTDSMYVTECSYDGTGTEKWWPDN